MKVKMVLKFRGREMAHKEFGFQTVQKFIAGLTPYAHPDNEPKLVGRGITVMLSPLPRAKRAKNPFQSDEEIAARQVASDAIDAVDATDRPADAPARVSPAAPEPAPAAPAPGFANNPFAQLSEGAAP